MDLGIAYLFYNEMQVLDASLDLISDSCKLDLAARLETLLNWNLKDAILYRLLASALVECLSLDLHLLGAAGEQIFEGDW